MAHIVWDEKMSVQVGLMDTQHKKLIEVINDFYSSMGSNNSKEKILEVIKAMKDYTFFHFNAEEKLMQQNAYPDFEKHKKEHQAFIDKVHDMEERYKSGKLILTLEVASFLKTWLTNHIMQVDKKYGDYLNARGIR